MKSLSILNSDTPYSLRGFQSLSDNKTLGIRTGSASTSAKNYVAPQWCPKTDVIAVPEGRALRLIRLSGGQTVWRRILGDEKSKLATLGNRQTDNVIRAIAWSPQGKTIAVLHADGLLVQREWTCGDIVHEVRLDIDDKVVAMEWVAGQVDYEDIKWNLPQLSPLDRGQPAPSTNNALFETLSAIVVVGASGAVWVSLGGIFTLPPARPSSQNWTCPTAINARVCRDRLFVYTVDQTAQAALYTVDIPLLTSSTKLISAFVPLSAHFSSLCVYVDHTLDMLVKEAFDRQQSASRSFLLHAFEQVLRDYGVDEVTSPESELCQYAVSRRPSEATSHFLLAKLKSTKLTQWESAGRLGAKALVRLIYQNALPAIERALLVASKLLELVPDLSAQTADDNATSSVQHNILRAITMMGWLYSRLNEYMEAILDEQRENQEFVDWALAHINDLHWQNNGSRRHGNEDGDDGLRPPMPTIDYKTLLRFFHKTFGHSSDVASDGQSNIQHILHVDDEHSHAQNAEFRRAYFDEVVRRANLDTLKVVARCNIPHDNAQDPFGFVFNSTELLEAVMPPDIRNLNAPTCVEAWKEAKSLISQALEWPSHVLRHSVQWNPEPVASTMLSKDMGEATLSDIHYISGNSQSTPDLVFTATTTNSSRYLILLLGSAKPQAARIELTVDVATVDGTRKNMPINVTWLTFFDDNMLGIAFTIDECAHPFLGTISYRSSPKYYNVSSDTQLLEIKHASASIPNTVIGNGNQGRRCIAVIEIRGKAWWPYDMDNEEDSSDSDE
ncbi:hypothetical protein IWW36_004686 [Coemansia brasiliensis]|uniref:Anaphase-promoting complex subunit 4 n=1 Tax=Coemansia brasiliensis TaxID=2650707 RepID=A0A9W8I337_9FUNG|nr:hypothetical protein IWW36_004686 [Coemansia brasiliensis]